MDKGELESRKQRLIESYGPWTAHNIHLGHGVYTISEEEKHDCSVVSAIISDYTNKKFNKLRILDLGCLEGLYSVEFAKEGAEVLGIEGRRGNVQKALFAKDALGLSRLLIEHMDVRELSPARHGRFDVVLCRGVLYHLPAPDVFAFLSQMKQVCSGVAIINTHFAPLDTSQLKFQLGSLIAVSHQGHDYQGRMYREHPEDSTEEEIESRAWASLDNYESFWLTRSSLQAGLQRAGFTRLYHCLTYYNTSDRMTVIATT